MLNKTHTTPQDKESNFGYYFLITGVLASILLYKVSFSAYFFQDDWFTLRISRADNLNALLRFFIPRTDVIYYRPLGMQIPFYLIQKLFGLNPVPFHLLTMLIHITNIFLVFYLVKLILKKQTAAGFSAFLYGSSSVHFIPMFWSSTFPFIEGPVLFFLSVILFIRHSEKENNVQYLFSFIVFLTGLLVNEIVSVIPLVILSYCILSGKIKESVKVIPYFLGSIVLFILRFIVFHPPARGHYGMGLGFHLVSNLKTYLLWSMNWSEIVTEQMTKLFFFNSLIMDKYSLQAAVTVFSFLIISALPAIFIIQNLRKSDTLRLKYILFGLVWFLAGLLPVLPFIEHKFSYYLPIPLVGLIICFSYVLSVIPVTGLSLKNRRILLVLFAAVWLSASFSALDINLKEHWAPRRAAISRVLIQKALKDHPAIPPDGNILIPDSSENRLALNNQDAFRVVYADANLITIYTKMK